MPWCRPNLRPMSPGSPLPLKATVRLSRGGKPPGSEQLRCQDLHTFTSNKTRHWAIQSHPVGRSSLRRYQRCRPEKTPLHKTVSENLESWLEWREQAERRVTTYVEDDLSGYLECGILCFGFRRALCTDCGRGVSSLSPARAAASVRPATVSIWRRPPPISSIKSSRRCPCGSG
jgi:hypothetical protein